MPSTRELGQSTSFRAAFSINTKNISDTQVAICAILHQRPLNDEKLIEKYKEMVALEIGVPRASDSGIRSRRAELVERGLIEDSGERIPMRSGRMSIVWRYINA